MTVKCLNIIENLIFEDINTHKQCYLIKNISKVERFINSDWEYIFSFIAQIKTHKQILAIYI